MVLVEGVNNKIVRNNLFDRRKAYRASNSECADGFTEMCCNGIFDDFNFQVDKLTDGCFKLIFAYGNVNLATVR